MQTQTTQILLAVMLLTTPALATVAGAQPAESHPTLAIVDFEAVPGGWTLPPPRLGTTVAQLMLDRLVASAQFHVLDGQWLQRGNPGPRSGPALDRLRADADAAGVD